MILAPENCLRRGDWRKIPITLITRTGIGQFSTCEIACLRQLSRPHSIQFHLVSICSRNSQLHFKLIEKSKELSRQPINIDRDELAHRINLDPISPVTAEFVILRNGKLGFG